MSDLAEFLRARLDEDEAVARRAVDPERPGTHWQWVTAETDVPVAHGDEPAALQHQAVSLRTVEEFTSSVGQLPAFIIYEEDGSGRPEALAHIARHDPARVLAEVEAKREIVDRCAAVGYAMPSSHLAQGILATLALPYADHPDYREEWRP